MNCQTRTEGGYDIHAMIHTRSGSVGNNQSESSDINENIDNIKRTFDTCTHVHFLQGEDYNIMAVL